MTKFWVPQFQAKIIFLDAGASYPLASMTLASAENNPYKCKFYFLIRTFVVVDTL